MKTTKQKKNNSLFWVIAIVGIGLLTFGMIKLAMLPKSEIEPNYDVLTIKADDHFRGNSEALVTIIEYSDFQCPACRYYFDLTQQLTAEMGEQVKLVYRHFPLQTIHPHAKAAALAAEAAGQQNKFWEIHDLLFTNQASWSELDNPQDAFVSYAEELELDLDKFTADLSSDIVKNKVQTDLTGANQLNLNGTPTFFINGNKINNPRSYNDLVNEVNKYLNQSAN